MPETWFEILGIQPTDDDRLIHEAYRNKRAEFNEDRERLSLLKKAYDVLASPILRSKYLKTLKDNPPLPRPEHADSPTIVKKPEKAAEVSRGLSYKSSSKRLDTEAFEPEREGKVVMKELPSKPESSRKHHPTESLMSQPEEKAHGQLSKPTSAKKHEPTQAIGEQSPDIQEPIITLPHLDQKRGETVGIKPGPGDSEEKRPPEPTPGERTKHQDTQQANSPESDQQPVACVLFSYHGESKTIALKAGTNWIGRLSKDPHAPCPDILLSDPEERYISRKHAVIELDGALCTVKDTESDNGTYLNGKRLEVGTSYQLEDGDVIVIEGRELQVRLSKK